MNLKDLFAKATTESGTLTYDQLMALAGENGVKLVDLSEGQYVSQSKYDDLAKKHEADLAKQKSTYDNELSLRDTRITELNDNITKRDTDFANLKTQLENAKQDEAKLNQLQQDFTSLQTKYDDDKKSYESKLAQQSYEFAVKEFVSEQQFTSKAAKRDFTRAMLDKKLQMEDGRIMGAQDFVELYKKDNDDAFKVPEPPKPVEQPKVEQPKVKEEPKPTFVAPTTQQQTVDKGEKDLFHFNFTPLHPKN